MRPTVARGTKDRWRAAALALACALAATPAAMPPSPALADAGGDTALYVEGARGREQGDAGSPQQSPQQRATVAGTREASGATPKTGDATTAPVALALAGTGAAVAGAAVRKARRRPARPRPTDEP